jgi:hypothetical protein
MGDEQQQRIAFGTQMTSELGPIDSTAEVHLEDHEVRPKRRRRLDRFGGGRAHHRFVASRT